MIDTKTPVAQPPASPWPESLPRLDRSALLELAVILVVGLYFARSLLNLDALQRPAGNEGPLLIGLNQLIQQGIAAGQFPLWQSTSSVGLPLLANPDVSFFNPFVAPLTLLLGAVNGMKVALAVSLCFGGLGAWLLAWSMGLQRFGRVWSAAVLMFSGGMINHFHSGIYPLGLGAAWIPLTLAAFALVLKTDWKWPRVLGLVAMVGLILSGHLYFPVITGTALGLMLLIWSVEERWQPQSTWAVAWKRLLACGAVLVAAGGLTAFLLIPQREWASLAAYDASDPSRIEWRYALLTYFVDSIPFYDSRVFYSPGIVYNLEPYQYLGRLPLLFLLFVIPAFKRGRRREMVFLASLIVLGLVWADPEHLGGKYIAAIFPFFAWFKHVFRALILGAVGLSMLSGIGLDYLLGLFDRWQQTHGKLLVVVAPDNSLRHLPVVKWGKALVLIVVLASFPGYVQANGRLVGTVFLDPVPDEVLTWIESYHGKPDAYYVQMDVWWWHLDVYRHNTLWLNGFKVPFRPYATPSDLPLRPEPLYVLNGQDPLPDAELVRKFGEGQFFRRLHPMPYAFRADLTNLAQQDPAQYAQFVAAVPAQWLGPNEVSLTTDSPGGERLAAFVQYYPGWEVWIDGQRGRMARTTEYLGVDTLPGQHTYRFVFNPFSVKLGLAVTLATLAGVLVYAFVPVGRWDVWTRRFRLPAMPPTPGVVASDATRVSK